MITASGVVKGAATASASAGLLGFGALAWTCAIIGAFFSVYLEDAKEPKQAFMTVVNILAYAFAAALLAIALPNAEWFGIGKFASAIPIEVRAGILGLSIRWAVMNGKGVLTAKAKRWGSE
jgi:ABC-type Na+ efflux pump permease subunit